MYHSYFDAHNRLLSHLAALWFTGIGHTLPGSHMTCTLRFSGPITVIQQPDFRSLVFLPSRRPPPGFSQQCLVLALRFTDAYLIEEKRRITAGNRFDPQVLRLRNGNRSVKSLSPWIHDIENPCIVACYALALFACAFRLYFAYVWYSRITSRSQHCSGH